MNNKSLSFHFVLVATLIIVFFIHKKLVESDILLSLYAINALAAIIVYNFAFFFRKRSQDYLGYFFLGGTALKFFIFFIYVLPVFKQDDHQTKEEFFSFFVPYLVALIVETTSLIFLLKQGEKKKIKN